MQIEFLGAAQTVTGSQHLIHVNGKQILLDCGLYQGRRQDSYIKNRNFAFKPQEIDAVILSHAHIDHSGNLPNLVKSGYKGPIYTTNASAHLANIMLMDSGHLQELDAEYVNKKRQRRGEPPVEPIYTMEDAAHVAQYFAPMDYDEVFTPVEGVTARLIEAGHILGSAAVELNIVEGDKRQRLWFSGDIGRRNLPLLRDPVLPQRVDTMIMECTYGDKVHRDPELAYIELGDVVGRTIERGGKVIVPAFAVGRTQEIVYSLNRMFSEGKLTRVPVYVDSPLAVNASDVFRAHPECFDAETLAFMSQNGHKNALTFANLTYIRSVEESKALNERSEPMIIISASGMAEAGRVLHHLKNNIENPRNTVLIVSWQAPYTLGRRLADREPEVRIFGETYQRRAEVATIGGLSAHAGQALLTEYALSTRETVKNIYLVHGEAIAAGALIGKLAENGLRNVEYPVTGQRVDF